MHGADDAPPPGDVERLRRIQRRSLDNALPGRPTVVLTPPVAFNPTEALDFFADAAARNIEDFLAADDVP